MAGLTSSTIGRKYAMALSALFLLIFLILHLTTNLLSVLNRDAFNTASDFMGYNPFVQFLMQPILGFAVFFHFIMGFVLEIKNNKARPVKYASNNASKFFMDVQKYDYFRSCCFGFLALHFYDFWFMKSTTSMLRNCS
jgi:succinate dehydrogenase / fumarate reductase cytochrome b subunit